MEKSDSKCSRREARGQAVRNFELRHELEDNTLPVPMHQPYDPGPRPATRPVAPSRGRGLKLSGKAFCVRPVDRIHSTGGSAPTMEGHSFPSGRLYHGESLAVFGNAGRPGRPRRRHSFQFARKARRSRLPRARPDPPARLIPPTTNASQYHSRTVPVGGSSTCFQMISPVCRRARNGSSANSDSGIGPKRCSVTSRRPDSFGGVESRRFIPHDSCCSPSR